MKNVTLYSLMVALALSLFPERGMAGTGEETHNGCAGDGYSVTVNGTLYDEANPTGTETLTAASYDGTDSIVNVNLVYNPPPSVTNQSYTFCEDTPGSGMVSGVDLTAFEPAIFGGGFFGWYSDAGLTTPVAVPTNTPVWNGDVYYTEVYDPATGCTSTASVAFTIESKPSVTDQTDTACEDTPGSNTATVDLTAYEASMGATGYNVGWYMNASLDPASQIGSPSNVTLLVGQPVCYAQIIDPTTSCASVATVTFTIESAPSVTDQNPSVCPDTQGGDTSSNHDLTALEGAIGSGTFDWYGDAGLTTSVADPTSVTAMDGDQFFAVVTAASNGCTSVATVTYSIATITPIINASAPELTCAITAVSLDATSSISTGGGLGYSWEGPSGFTSSQGIISATEVGNYTVTLTDATTGCTATTDYTVTQDISPPIAIITQSDSELSCAVPSITLDASLSTGQGVLSYAWSDGAISVSITVSDPGTYVVTVTDSDNGCVAVQAVTVTLGTPPPTANITASNSELSCAVTSMILDASSSTGQGTLSHEWSTGEISTMITATASGTYTVTVYDDASGCTATANYIVTQDITPPTPNITPSNPELTCEFSSIILDASSSTGQGTMTYMWSTSATGTLIAASSPGTYTVTVVDSNGCTATTDYTVTQDITPPTAIITPSAPELSCDVTSMTLDAGASTGQGTLSYMWVLDGETSSTSVVSFPGTYTVIVTDSDNGCTATQTVTVTTAGPSATAALDNPVSCFGGADGTATVTATGGDGSYTYEWPDGQSTATAVDLSAGYYVVTVTDGTGCTVTDGIDVPGPSALVLSVSTVDVSCFGGSDGSATAIVTGGTVATDYSYNWADGQTGQTATGLAAGTYTVTVMDDNGCTATTDFTITEPDALIASIIVDNNPSCTGSADGGMTATALGGTAPYAYTWSSGIPDGSGGVTGLLAGIYAVTVTDAHGCTATAESSLSEPPPLSVSVNVDANASCVGSFDGMMTATASGGAGAYFYQWSNGVSSTATMTGLVAGTYTVTVTDVNGCTASAESTLYDPAELTASATMTQEQLSCATPDGAALITADGGTAPYLYEWGNGATVANPTDLTAGTYAVTVTDNNGCTVTTTVEITANFNITLTETITNVDCFGNSTGAIALSITGSNGGPYTTAWSAGTDDGNGGIMNLTAGTYYVTTTDVGGCSRVDFYEITEPDELSLYAAVNANVPCNGGLDGAATLTATGGVPPYAYSWDNGETTSAVTGLSAGTYQVTVTDANGCTAVTSVSISEPPVLVASSAVMNNVSCFNGSDGSATATATGGVGNFYTYTWSTTPMQISQTAVGLSAGIYTVTITDNNGCTATAESTITEPSLLSVSVDVDVSCANSSDGAVTATASGGVGAYVYTWTTGESSATMVGYPAGTYTVTVTDSNGCTASVEAIITEGGETIADITASALELTCTTTSITLDAGTSTGDGALTYSWSNTETTLTTTITIPGDYTVTVTGETGCSATASVTITENTTPPTVNISGSTTFCTGSSSTLDAGAGFASYLWSNGEATQVTSINTGGDYTVTVTSADNGCTATASVSVTEDSSLTPIINGDLLYCIENGGTTLDVGAGFQSYAWSSGETTSNAFVPVGTYTVTVTDATGCTGSSSVTVGEYPSPQPTISGMTEICAGESVAISAEAGYSAYLWSDGSNAQTATISVAGSYTVTVIDGNGCTGTASTQITTINPGNIFTVSDWGGQVMQFDATTGDGQLPYSYEWTLGNGQTLNTTEPSLYYQYADYGNYTVCLTATDATGLSCTECQNIYVPEGCLFWNGMNMYEGCSWDYDPICGCNGITYSNSCIAYQCYGVQSWTDGPCGNPPACATTAEFFYYGELSSTAGYDMEFWGGGNNVESYTWEIGDGLIYNGQNQSINVPPFDTLMSLTVCLTTSSSATNCDGNVCETFVLDATPNGFLGGQIVEGQNLMGNPEVLRVMSAEGDPIEGVLVELQKYDGSIIATTTTDASGGYLFEELMFGDYFIHVNIDGIPHEREHVKLIPIFQNDDNVGFEVNSTEVVSGTEGISFASDIRLSPNPTSHDVRLAMTLPERADMQVSVVNMLGKTVLEEQHDLPAGRQTVELSLEDLPSGMYILNLRSGGESYSRKVMKE